MKRSNILLTQAYSEQCQIGWDQFQRGRISKKWYNAYQCLCHNSGVSRDSALWSSYLISSIIKYTTLLWQYRCGVLHGHTKMESEQKLLQSLCNEITILYQEYSSDPFMIPRSLSTLFTSQTLTEQLQYNRDNLECWLRSVQEAKATQLAFHECLAHTAKTFFNARTRNPHTNKPTPDKSLIHTNIPITHHPEISHFSTTNIPMCAKPPTYGSSSSQINQLPPSSRLS